MKKFVLSKVEIDRVVNNSIFDFQIINRATVIKVGINFSVAPFITDILLGNYETLHKIKKDNCFESDDIRIKIFFWDELLKELGKLFFGDDIETDIVFNSEKRLIELIFSKGRLDYDAVISDIQSCADKFYQARDIIFNALDRFFTKEAVPFSSLSFPFLKSNKLEIVCNIDATYLYKNSHTIRTDIPDKVFVRVLNYHAKRLVNHLGCSDSYKDVLTQLEHLITLVKIWDKRDDTYFSI